MYYKRIKGAGGKTSSADSGYFTYIYFMDEGYNGDSEQKWDVYQEDNHHISHSPFIAHCESGDKLTADNWENVYDLGHILTTNCVGGYFTNDFTFKGSVVNKKEVILQSSNTTYGALFASDGVLNLNYYNNGIVDKNNKASYITLSNGQVEIGGHSGKGHLIFAEGALNFYANGLESNNYIKILGQDNGNKIQVQGLPYESDSYVQCSYFNATSDRRAKINIVAASFNALSIINSLPIYTFNYKNNNSPSIGVIAQEATKIDFGTDFNLVDHPDASGENGDYMTVKESKMVYVAWKAIQEQQDLINELRSEIDVLKKEINILKG